MLSTLAPEKKNLVNQPLLIHADRESPAIESFKSCSKYSTSPWIQLFTLLRYLQFDFRGFSHKRQKSNSHVLTKGPAAKNWELAVAGEE